MLIDEASAKLRFCPLQRAAVRVGNSDKFVTGVNVDKSGTLTHCEGSACMLWETQQQVAVPTKTTCPDCEGKRDKVADCKKCTGSGEITVQVPHNIGFCGAGFQGPLAASVAELNKTLAAILVTVRGKQQKDKAVDDGTTPPPGSSA